MARRERTSAASQYSGSWFWNASSSSLPKLWLEFRRNRDPYTAAQIADLKLSEAERREEQSGRGSGMVGTDKPQPSPKPPKHISRQVDAKAFQARWLAEQRDAVMAKAEDYERMQHRSEVRRERAQQQPERKFEGR